MKIIKMPEHEIAAIETSVDGYELENYPITGVELASLIASQRHYKSLAELAAPTMLANHEKSLILKAYAKYGWIVSGGLLVSLLSIGGLLTLSHSYVLFGESLGIHGTLSDFFTVSLAVGVSIIVPMLLIFYPSISYAERKMREEVERLKVGPSH